MAPTSISPPWRGRADGIFARMLESRLNVQGTQFFTEMECARVRLICMLHYELEIDADTLPVVLSLVDQLYDTRQRLLSLTAAVTAQDKNVQAAIIAAMKPNAGPDKS